MAGVGASDLFGAELPPRTVGRQLPLPLAWRQPPGGPAEFLVGESNLVAVRALQHLGDQPVPVAILRGPSGSGKSHLGRVFAETAEHHLIDGLPRDGEETAFHLWNRVRTDGGALLIILDADFAIDNVALPDLRTRLAASLPITIDEPDVALAGGIIDALLQRRGHGMAKGVGDFAAQRIERRYVALHAAVAAIDHAAIASRRPINRALVRQALADAGLARAA